MTMQTSMLHVRVDQETKDKATEALGAMGLSVSDAVRLLLHRIVTDQAFPLELKVPNAESRKAIAEANEIVRKRDARFASGKDLTADPEKTGGK